MFSIEIWIFFDQWLFLVDRKNLELTMRIEFRSNLELLDILQIFYIFFFKKRKFVQNMR